MKAVTLISRILLGAGFIIFGLNILHPFLASPPPPEGSLAAQFVAVMIPTVQTLSSMGSVVKS
jgi:hypothetical protein